jgi:hypothetical protein
LRGGDSNERAYKLQSSLGLEISPDCPYDQSQINRFESKVLVLDCGCWGWKGGKCGVGHGQFVVSKGVFITANRASYKIYKGPINKGERALRIAKCKTRGCCNPACLKKGGAKDHRSIKRGTHVYNLEQNRLVGEKVSGSKLTDRDVLEIRVACEDRTLSWRELGKLYGVSHQVPRRIARGEAWKHLPTDPDECKRLLEGKSETKAVLS